jgi:hypothetical protein
MAAAADEPRGRWELYAADGSLLVAAVGPRVLLYNGNDGDLITSLKGTVSRVEREVRVC